MSRQSASEHIGSPWDTLRQIWLVSREVFPMLVLALVGLLISGTLLEHMSRWNAFVKVDKLFILVPILFNLKGNLEMNLSLRMATAANIGELDNGRTRRALVAGNLALLQVQAIIVAGAAGILSFLLGMGTNSSSTTNGGQAVSVSSALSKQSRRGFVHSPNRTSSDPSMALRGGYFEFVLVLAVAMLSASASSGVQGAFLAALVIITRRLKGDPDNTAVPIAGSFGDLLTLTVLGIMSASFVHFEGTILSTIILILLVLACVAFLIVTLRNVYARELVAHGWVPLFAAMLISSGAGVMLDKYSEHYDGFALLVPVVSGLPGAAAAILVSRITTALHSGKFSTQNDYELIGTTEDGPIDVQLPTEMSIPPPTLFGRLKSLHIPRPIEGMLVPCILFSNTLIVQMFFLLILWLTKRLSFGWLFSFTFFISTTLSISLALVLAHCMAHVIWQLGLDPDTTCLPYTTSIVDVLSQVILLGAFSLTYVLDGKVTTN